MSASPSQFATMTSAPAPLPAPACVRSRSLHPSDVQPVSQVAMQRPPQKHVWAQESIPPPYAPPSFPLDPSLYGHTVSVLSRGPPNGVQLIPSPMPPTPVQRLLLPTQYHAHPGNAVHYLPHPSMDARMLQRSHSDYGPSMVSHPTDPRVVYNYRVHADQRGPSMGWNATEVILHPSSAPRQRSAKACKKCRRRKTKCSGGQPCTRCNARGLDCEYDEKAAPRGPSKARMELRKKPSKTGSIASRTSSPTDSPDEKPSGDGLHYLDKASPTLEAPAYQPSADLHPPQAYIAHNVIPPALDESSVPSFGDTDPAFYAPFVGDHHPPAPSDGAPDASSLIQGYTVPEEEETVVISPVLPDGAWQMGVHGFDFDDSDSSRPSSSHSTSSTSSWSVSESSLASSASSAQTIWSTSLPRYPAGRPVHHHTLHTSASSSSLKDALLDKPRLRTSLSTPSIAHVAAADASLLTDVLRHASLSESGSAPGAPSETSLAPSHASDTSAFAHPTTISDLDFADVLSHLAADHSQHSPISPTFAPAHDEGDVTLRGRGAPRGLTQHYPFASSGYETTQVSDAYQFGGPMHHHSPPDLHGAPSAYHH